LILQQLGWEERYLTGQSEALEALSRDDRRGAGYVATHDQRVIAFISVAFHRWNRLGQIHGLAVEPDFHRQKVASGLVLEAEQYVRSQGGRGIYVDTPVTNRVARAFYTALGYREDYVMSQYYDVGLDGVTYVKFFSGDERLAVMGWGASRLPTF
jgi:ribosomal protein S18 acetylase RimI-like enzyme